MKSTMKTFIMLIILGICMGTVSVAAAENGSVNATTEPTVTATANQTPTVVATVATTVGEGKFRVGPTVRIRPLNDVISKDQDGLIELYMDNPSLNDITLTVDARISVPSGIHVYGQSFGEAGAAGMVYGKFDVPPGTARTINIVIKADKTGNFNSQLSAIYWPGDNKDAFQQISLTHPFTVTAPSKDPLKDTSGEIDGDKGKTERSPGMTAILAIFAIVILIYGVRRRT